MPMAAGASPTAAAWESTGSKSTSASGTDPGQRVLPEPFGQHIFGALADLHPLVERGRVRAAVRQQVIPSEQLPRFRLHRLADDFEAGRAAILRLVQIDHRGP